MDAGLLRHRPTTATTTTLNPKRHRTHPTPAASPVPADTDSLLESILSLPTDVALDVSLDRLIQSKPSDSDQDEVIDRVLRLGSALTEAAKRSARRRASSHNGVVWPLPQDLTIKVFSLLDTQSLCHAAAACSFFHKCSADPVCYSCIDLTTVFPRVNNMVVSTMIQRAGKMLRSLKLGTIPCMPVASLSSQELIYSRRSSSDASGFSWNDKRSRQGKDPLVLTRTCLAPLIASGGSPGPGALLRRLHLYNIDRMDNRSYETALSACPALLDLEIVGLHVELTSTLESVSRYCPQIERLYLESSTTGRDDSLKLPTCKNLVNDCPQLASLTLRGFKVHDCNARVLVKGFRRLKYVDFSTSYSITGSFLWNLGGTVGGNLLEVLILRDCMHLREVEVSKLLSAILAGRFKYLRFLDISNREGLASDGDWYHQRCAPSFEFLDQVSEERPNLCVVADFPAEASFAEEPMTGSDLDSDINSPSSSSSRATDDTPTSSPSISFSSDQGSSGNEDSSGSSDANHEESSEEVNYL